MDGLRASGDERANEMRRDAESGRALGGIENTEAAAGAGADVEQTPPLTEAIDDAVDSPGNRRKLAGDGGGDSAILAIHDADDLERRFVIEIARGQVALFGAPAFSRRRLFR